MNSAARCEGRRSPGDWWTEVLQSVTDDGRHVTLQDELGNRFVVVSEEHYRALKEAPSAGRGVPTARVRLTAREREILQLLSEGLACSAIGTRLDVAPNTVAQHLASVRRKYGVRSSATAAAHARSQGLID